MILLSSEFPSIPLHAPKALPFEWKISPPKEKKSTFYLFVDSDFSQTRDRSVSIKAARLMTCTARLKEHAAPLRVRTTVQYWVVGRGSSKIRASTPAVRGCGLRSIPKSACRKNTRLTGSSVWLFFS